LIFAGYLMKLESIRELPANTQGKDYIVGDLHGCYALLERLLNEVQFAPAQDRLFSVGDLVDRGPDSLRCLQLLDEPWFYAVMGNHEEMLLECFLPYLDTGKLASLDEINDTDCLKNGGEWVTQHYLPEQQRMTDDFNRGLLSVFALPLVLIVGEGDNRFNIIHAELIRPDYRIGGQPVWLDCGLDQWLQERKIPDDTYERLLWGRLLNFTNRFGKEDKFDDIQPGLSTTFCGHTPMPSPNLILSHLNIDTGAYMTLNTDDVGDEGYGLTLVEVRTRQWLKASGLNDEIVRGDIEFTPD
jgi:serine/threonine protein phosphatase 1